MPSISLRDATDRLIEAVKGMDPYELLDFYNEVFPATRKAALTASDAGESERATILDYLTRGIEIDETLDYFTVAFPIPYRAWFDEEDGLIHYRELAELVEARESGLEDE